MRASSQTPPRESSRSNTACAIGATSRGLPGIRRARLEPDTLEYSPNIDEEDVDPVAVGDAMKAASQPVRTVGPTARPKQLDLVAFTDYIASLRSEAETLGWVRPSPDVSNLDSLLTRLRNQLARGEFGRARASAAAFATAVESASCSDFDCPPDRALTAEARALLALNMEFLKSRIPAAAAPSETGR
jgi:hypothetical protein